MPRGRELTWVVPEDEVFLRAARSSRTLKEALGSLDLGIDWGSSWMWLDGNRRDLKTQMLEELGAEACVVICASPGCEGRARSQVWGKPGSLCEPCAIEKRASLAKFKPSVKKTRTYWTADQEFLLVEYSKTMTASDAAELLGKTVDAIKNRCGKLGVRCQRPKLRRRTGDDVRRSRCREDKLRLSRYGLTSAQFDQMLKDQEGRCGACGVVFDEEVKLYIDHCHETGRVRGLLCLGCNASAGYVGDDPKRLRLLADYLERGL